MALHIFPKYVLRKLPLILEYCLIALGVDGNLFQFKESLVLLITKTFTLNLCLLFTMEHHCRSAQDSIKYVNKIVKLV